jgi:hypothetical protein
VPLIGPAVVWGSLAILRVKIKGVWRKSLGISLNINVEVEGIDALFTIVGDGNAGVLLKWHGEERIEGFVGSDAEWRRLE